MSKRIDVIVSDDLYELLKTQADEEGMSLSDYAARQLDETAMQPHSKPTKEQVLEWLAQIPPIKGDFDTAELIREGREEREEELWQAIRGSLTDDRR